MAMKKPKCLTLLEKSKIIEESNKGASVTYLSKKYGVAKSTVCAIKNKKRNILKAVSDTFSGPGKRKTLKGAEEPLMEQKLYKWFLKQRENNFLVSGLMLKEKAKYFYKELNKTGNEFNASDGWLDRFKKRFGIRLLQVTGEKLSSQPELVLPFKDQLRAKIEELDLCNDQIYNADESGLFWKLLPNKTYVTWNEKSAPGKKSEKQRITFLACTNATGDHKLKPFVIGKAKNPRCFKNFSCPVDYVGSSRAWMTAAIFKEWFYKKFVPQVKTFLKERQLPIKALLLLDNAPSHPPADELRAEEGNIFVMYMPPNVTPLIQPMDQNVIRITKLFYRKHLLSSIVAKNSGNLIECLKQITLRDAVTNLAIAWDSLERETIRKCWNNILLPHYEDEDNIPLSEIKKQLLSNVVISTSSSIIHLLTDSTGENACTPEEVLQWNEDNLSIHDLSEENTDDEDDIVPIDAVEDKKSVSSEEAVESFSKVIEWAQEQSLDYADILVLRRLREKAVSLKVKKNLKQTTLSSFCKVIDKSA